MSSPRIITYPLGGITYDAEDAAAYFAGRTSGVYSTDIDFAVAAAADGNTDLTVSAGQAWMHVSRWVGLSVTMREAQTLTLPLADSALPRIDRVAVCAVSGEQKNCEREELYKKRKWCSFDG